MLCRGIYDAFATYNTAENMLRLKIPPPVVTFLAGILVWSVNIAFPAFKWDFSVFKLTAIVIALVGVSIEIWSVILFIKNRTTINPIKPHSSKHLVTDGLYRFSRNPMYLGMLLILTGFVFWVGNPMGAAILILFVWYLTSFQIKPEEIALDELFGAQFSDYRTQVRRWL